MIKPSKKAVGITLIDGEKKSLIDFLNDVMQTSNFAG
jgi:hypothetical protein